MLYIKDNFKNIKFIIDNALFQLPPKEQEEADKLWLKRRKESDLLYNGWPYSCKNITFEGSGMMSFDIVRIEYKTYIWARETKADIKGFYPIGVMVVIYDPVNKVYVMARRSKKVAFSKNDICLIGGVLEHKGNVLQKEFPNFILNTAYKEVSEELITKQELKLENFKQIGLYIDQEKFRLNFLIYCKIKEPKLRNDENKTLLHVKPKDLNNFLQSHKKEIDKVAYYHLYSNLPELSSLQFKS